MDHNKLKILENMEIHNYLACLLRNPYAGQKATVEPDMEQWNGFKLGEEYIEIAYCHPAYLTSMQGTSCEMIGWMKNKLESSLQLDISIMSDLQMMPPL